MNRILHDVHHAERILQITADTLILVKRDGTCVDIDTHSTLWFLQEEKLLGKNLLDLLPEKTRQKITFSFEEVLSLQKKISRNYRLDLDDGTYYFKCIMYPYDGMILCQYRDITERSNVKLQLERTNHELREIQKAAQIGQWKYNTAQNRLYYWGYTGIICAESVSEISIEHYTALVIDEDRPAFLHWMAQNQLPHNEPNTGYRICYNGEIFYLRLKTYLREAMPDGSYNIEGYIQNATDIQRRRNDINTLTRAINNARENIFAATEDGTLLFANHEFRSHHHLPDQVKLEDLKIYNLAGDMQTLESWHRRCWQARPGESSSFIAYHPVRDNPNILAFEGVIYRVTGDEGEVSYWSFSHDITERLRYESQIKRLNRIMDTTMQNLPASIVVKDIGNDYRYIYRNRQLYDRSISLEKAVGKNDFDYHPLELAEKKRAEDLEIVRTGQELHWIIEDTAPDGRQRILDKRKIKVESSDFSPIIISIEWDITQLEQMKRELVAEKEKAENSNRLKSAFLANMSHEIRTPLNAIVGFSRIISESADTDERKAYYQIVDANNERLLTLINEILDLSKIESGIIEFTITPVKVHRLCKEIYDAHIFRCPAGVELVFEPSDEVLVIDTDKNRIFQVISNLIGNAFKFTTDGNISYGYHQEGDIIRFHVTDTGLGIAPDKVGKVFERFVKVNNFAQGTGLGLSICKTIIERLNGEISVVSELGKGTTFTFSLPARAATSAKYWPAEQLKANDLSAEDSPTKRLSTEYRDITILIAEDTDSNYQLLEAILGKTYHLQRATDGMQAVTLFDEIKPDIILMDIKMPNLDGLEATRIIRELSPTVPIIAQSAYAFGQDRQAAAEAGCNDFLSKPIVQEVLIATINKYC